MALSDTPKLVISSLQDVSVLSDFCCGIEEMDDFIHNHLQESVSNHYCNSYVVRLEDVVVAMFALNFDSLNFDSDSREEIQLGVSQNVPSLTADYFETFLMKHHFPALEISYFAVVQKYRNQGIGRALIDAIADMAQRQSVAGCMFLTVEAYIKGGYTAVPFYDKCHFEPCEYRNPNKETLRMFRALYPKSEM